MQRRTEKITVALSELWLPSRAGLFCIQGAPRFLCQRGTREALNVTFRDARRFPPGAGGRRKEPMMLSQTCVLNARRGSLPQSSGQRDKKRITRPSGLAPLAPALGLTLSFI